jgi:citrate lyase beta subunit
VRSLLFVPGDSDRKQAKALGSEADALILDLEDSVAPEQRDMARRTVHELLAGERTKALWVRINACGSGALEDDLAAVLPAKPDGIVLPKVSGVRELATVGAQLPRAEQAIGNGDAQHRGLALDVQTIAKTQRAELVFRELASEEALGLIAEFGDTLVDESLVDVVVAIHGPIVGAGPEPPEIPFGLVGVPARL